MNGLPHTLLIFGIVAGLALAAAVNAAWFLSGRLRKTKLRMEGPALDDEEALAPVRGRMEVKKYEEAYAMLEPMVKSHRPNYSALVLMAQLSHHFKKDKQAEECLLTMIRIAVGEEEQLAAMRLYHEVAVA